MLEREQIDFAVSPLHDKDKWSVLDEKENPEHKAGEHKKEHYHVVLKFPSVKTVDQVQEILADFHQPKVQVCNSVGKYIQYFIHKNDPKKYQYNREDIESYGIDIGEYLDAVQLSKAEEHEAFQAIKDFMRKNEITRIRDVIYYADDNKLVTWQAFFERYSIKTVEWIADGNWQEKDEKRKGLLSAKTPVIDISEIVGKSEKDQSKKPDIF